MPLTRGDADTALLALRFRRWLTRNGERLDDPAFWLELNPAFCITDRAPSEGTVPYAASWAGSTAMVARLKQEGCFVTPPVVPPEDLAHMRDGIARFVDAGLPAFFLTVYDDLYRMHARLRPVVEPVLGADRRFFPQYHWVFWVPPGADTSPRWTTFGPHRDFTVPDPGVLAGELPTTLITWLALMDVTTDGSCVYVVPADCDPDYRSDVHDVRPDRVRLQDIRAMPVPAGAMLVMSSHLAHWGSRGSPFAGAPRLSVALIQQRRDAPPEDNAVASFDEPVPFRTRLRAVHANLGKILSAEEMALVDRALLG